MTGEILKYPRGHQDDALVHDMRPGPGLIHFQWALADARLDPVKKLRDGIGSTFGWFSSLPDFLAGFGIILGLPILFYRRKRHRACRVVAHGDRLF